MRKSPIEEIETKHQKMTRDENFMGEGDRWVHNRDRGTDGILPPRDQQEPGHRPRRAMRGEQTRYTLAEAGMRRGAQRRAAEADGWRVGVMSRWKIIHARRGCGEPVI